MAMLLRDTNNVVPAPPIHHGMLVQMGVSEPSDVIRNPTCKNFFKSTIILKDRSICFCNSYFEFAG
jgi:hypothetical protein